MKHLPLVIAAAVAFGIFGMGYNLGLSAGKNATQSEQATEAYLVATNALGVAELANQAEDEALVDAQICHDDLEFYREEMNEVLNDLEQCLDHVDDDKGVVYER